MSNRVVLQFCDLLARVLEEIFNVCHSVGNSTV